jgi:hypothetical protein
MRQVNIAIFIDYQKPTIKKTRISILSTLHFLFTSRSPRCNSANQPRFPGPLIFADQPLRLQQQKCSAKPLPTLCCVQVSAFLPRAEVETTYHFHAKAL